MGSGRGGPVNCTALLCYDPQILRSGRFEYAGLHEQGGGRPGICGRGGICQHPDAIMLAVVLVGARGDNMTALYGGSGGAEGLIAKFDGVCLSGSR